VTRGKFQGALRIKDVRVAIARSLSLFQKRRRASRAAAVQDASDIKTIWHGGIRTAHPPPPGYGGAGPNPLPRGGEGG
jgi:hypothetical protein